MAYTVFKADGTSVTVPDNAISNAFYDPNANGAGKGVGIQLLGRNVIDYGTAVAQDFVQLMSNFAGPNVPGDTTSQIGQTWFNTNDLNLYVKFTVAGTGAANWKITGGGGGGSGGITRGDPLYDAAGVLLGYSTPGIPPETPVSNFVPLNIDNNIGFAGWARAAAGDGMTTILTDANNTTIGYIYPPI